MTFLQTRDVRCVKWWICITAEEHFLFCSAFDQRRRMSRILWLVKWLQLRTLKETILTWSLLKRLFILRLDLKLLIWHWNLCRDTDCCRLRWTRPLNFFRKQEKMTPLPVEFECRGLQTLGRHHRSSLEAFLRYFLLFFTLEEVVTDYYNCFGFGCNAVYPWNSTVFQAPSASWRVHNEFSFWSELSL